MSSEITSEQLSCLIEHSDHVVTANHFVKVHRHLIIVHLITHHKITVLQQKSDAQEHQKGIATTELVRWWQRAFAQLIFARSCGYKISQLRCFLTLFLNRLLLLLLLRWTFRHGWVLMPTLSSLAV